MTIQTEGREFNELYDIWHIDNDKYLVKYQSDRKGSEEFDTYEQAKSFGEAL